MENKPKVGFYTITFDTDKAQEEANKRMGGKDAVLDEWKEVSNRVLEELRQKIK